jgi:Anti-sigma-K factor rskA, C-terminal/Putative zinc-finger
LSCEEIREDLEAYALGALEHARADEVEAHIEECEACAEIARDYQHAVGHLSLAVPLYRASPRLKARVMGGSGSINAVPGVLRTRWVMAAAAVVLLAFGVGGVVWASILSSEVSNLKTQNERLIALTDLDADQREAILQVRSDLNSARSEQARLSTTLEEYATLIKVALDPDLVPTELQATPLAGSASCSYVWSVKQSIGALTCKNLPATGVAKTYELWASKGSDTVPLGSFEPRIDGSGSLLVTFPGWASGPVTNLWVTLESDTGSRSTPSAQVVLRPAPPLQAQR